MKLYWIPYRSTTTPCPRWRNLLHTQTIPHLAILSQLAEMSSTRAWHTTEQSLLYARVTSYHDHRPPLSYELWPPEHTAWAIWKIYFLDIGVILYNLILVVANIVKRFETLETLWNARTSRFKDIFNNTIYMPMYNMANLSFYIFIIRNTRTYCTLCKLLQYFTNLVKVYERAPSWKLTINL